MTNPVILLGTQSNGETLPVQVDATGRLVAEGLQGVEGPEGPKGEQGEQGIPGEIDLPPDPQDGQVLGWKDGELAWLDAAAPKDPMEFDYLLVAGGGELFRVSDHITVGGGAGGVINSILTENTGGGGFGKGPQLFLPNQDYTITVGGKQENSSITGVTIDETAIAGGDAPGNDGGSGGGGMPYRVNRLVQEKMGAAELALNTVRGNGGISSSGQGFPGGAGSSYSDANCMDPRYKCADPHCKDKVNGGGGGGSAGPGATFTGGEAIRSSITGTPTYYGAGGQSNNGCDERTGPYPIGRGSRGSGGGWQDVCQPGIVILRGSKTVSIQVTAGDLQYTETEVGDHKVWSFTSGTGVVQFF